ncbi:MAG: homoserine dehydrogenase, partial [Lachnospiraceae bacterium]|nr:homoserine dehydrogenase [Lachnospiraceae bacterium]
AKHQGKFIFCFWDQEKVELSSKDEMSWKFFVRVKGNLEESGVKEVFGETEIIKLPECADEFAFITDEVSEKEFDEMIKGVKNVITRIRLEG